MLETGDSATADVHIERMYIYMHILRTGIGNKAAL